MPEDAATVTVPERCAPVFPPHSASVTLPVNPDALFPIESRAVTTAPKPAPAAVEAGAVTINDVIRPYLAAIPEPTGAPIGDGLAPHAFRFQQKLDQTFVQGRVDYQAGAHQFFARHTYDDGAQRLPTDYPAFPRSFISTNQFLTAEYRNVRSERTLQTARFGYSRTRIGQNVEAHLASPLPPFVAGRGLVGDIDIGGMQRFGPQTSANLRLAQNVYSGQYDLTHTRGRHLFKAGGLVERYRDFMTNPTFSLGIYTFANVRAFLVWSRFPCWTLRPEGQNVRVSVFDMRFAGGGRGFSQSVVVHLARTLPNRELVR